MKAWREGTPEPGAWQLELEDSTFATGAVGVTVRSDAASDPPPIFGVDDFAASARP